MTGVYKLRIVKGKVTRDQFRALTELISYIDELIGERVELITFGKHPERPIYTIKFFLKGREEPETVSDVLKKVDLRIVDTVHKYFDGKRNIITFSYSEQNGANNSNVEDNVQEAQTF